MHINIVLYNSQICEKCAEKKYVLRFDLNTWKVLDDATSNGRLFHVFAAANDSSDTSYTEPCGLLMV